MSSSETAYIQADFSRAFGESTLPPPIFIPHFALLFEVDAGTALNGAVKIKKSLTKPAFIKPLVLAEPNCILEPVGVVSTICNLLVGFAMPIPTEPASVIIFLRVLIIPLVKTTESITAVPLAVGVKLATSGGV